MIRAAGPRQTVADYLLTPAITAGIEHDNGARAVPTGLAVEA